MASPKNQLLDNQFGIPPELLDALAGGARAKQEMGLLQGKYDQAQQQANAQLPSVQGRGLAATAPTMTQAIANIVQQNSGRQRMKSLEAQAQQLGSQISEADIAKLGLQLRQKPQSQIGRYKQTPEGILDTSTGKTRPYTDSEGNPIRAPKKLTSGQQGDIAESKATIDALSGAEEKIRDAQVSGKEVYEPVKDSIINSLRSWGYQGLGNMLEKRIKTGEQLDVKAAMRMVTAQVRKQLSGAALTEMENALGQAWMPDATGIDDAEALRRLNNLKGYLQSKNINLTGETSKAPQASGAESARQRLESLREKQGAIKR